MPDKVTYSRDGDIAVIAVDNPPVNALSQPVRAGISDAIKRFDADEGAKAAVICGVGRTFMAGADIAEFGKPPREPSLPDVVNEVEAATKPVIASLHGTPLGGGLEIALGAHYRIAQPKTRLGLPEVHLGIVPGAGGTQRAPRLVGAEAALDMIATGRHVPAKEALAMGLIDEIDDGEESGGDPRAAGVAYARRLLAEGKGVRRTGDMDMQGGSPELFARWREQVAAKARGQHSPLACVDAVEAAGLPIAEGLAREREIITGLFADPQSPALVHAFFSERAVARIPEAKARPRKLETIGVIGGGTMGAGISAAALNAGLNVVMVERDAESIARGEANLRRNYASGVKKGRMTQAQLDAMLAEKFTPSHDYQALAEVDLVIEAVFETMEVKKQVFGIIDGIVKPGAVLASNTSYLDIDAIAACTRRPEDVIGLHFFSPAHIMRLLEVVVGEKTAPDVVATGFALARMMKKIAVRAGVCDGFIGNRILGSYMKAANFMVEDGADPYVIDAAVREFGYPMGPFQMMDLAGMDIGFLSRKDRAATRDPADRYGAGFLDEICERGWFGQKTERGFYDYPGGARSGPPNPEIMPIIEAAREKLGVTPREFTKEEIMRRYVAATVNEAAKVVGEGIALRPLDVDMASLFGYGYPRWRGGPMHYADHVGLDRILADIREFEKEDPRFWAAAPLLVELVESGRKFGDLNNG